MASRPAPTALTSSALRAKVRIDPETLEVIIGDRTLSPNSEHLAGSDNVFVAHRDEDSVVIYLQPHVPSSIGKSTLDSMAIKSLGQPEYRAQQYGWFSRLFRPVRTTAWLQEVEVLRWHLEAGFVSSFVGFHGEKPMILVRWIPTK